MNSLEQVRRYARAIFQRVLGVDLNVAPPVESQNGTSSLTRSLNSQEPLELGNRQPPPIDLEDDDVIVSSPRTFAQARSNPIRTCRRPAVVDVESEERLSRKKRRRTKKTDVLPPLPRPTSPLKNLDLTCPICLCELVEETSTKCGHIFCKQCITAALASQGKCPTCRKVITTKDTIRIYLPATSSA